MKKIFIIAVLLFTILSINVYASEELPKENSFRYENGVPITEDCDSNARLFSTESGTKGIDVSTFQGVIDWEAVKNDGVEFAIIRCGFGDDLTKYDDAQWKRNADECTRLGIPFGAYLYSYAASIEEAQNEAAHALRLLANYDLSYPVYLDLEDNTVGACSNELIGQIADVFCSMLQQHGYRVGIYANTSWWNTKLTSDVFQNTTWHKWVADWRGYCGYTGKYSMWQYTSSGNVSGISGGNVDMDYGYLHFDTVGDVDGDGDIDSDDYTYFTKILSAANTVQPWLIRAADINGDLKADIFDAYELQNIIENGGTDKPVPDTYEYPNTHINTGNLSNDIVGVAKTQIGYNELTSKNGTPVGDSEIPYYTKYGEAYGSPNGHWCAYFVLWCAKEAGIPITIVNQAPDCGSCRNFIAWFKNNHRWKDNSYTPKSGDIIFFDWDNNGTAEHVGIVESVNGDTIYTIEGNTGGVNGYAVMRMNRSGNILGYGVPDYELIGKINGRTNRRQTAYMLPDTNSQEVWYTDAGDDVQVICRDGSFYLILYPFNYTGKFVAGYVPISSVDVTGDIPVSPTAVPGTVNYAANVYHNASEDSLIGANGSENKIRASLSAGGTVEVLFEDGEFLFVRNESISGYVKKTDITYTKEEADGDINGDGFADAGDAGLILRGDAGLVTLTAEQIRNADINGDGFADAGDAGLVLRKDAGLIK